MNQPLFPHATPLVPIAGEARAFPVRRIYCVGKNYAAHVREMGADPAAEPPFFFMKPADAIVLERTVPYPSDTEDLHHEIELVVAIGRGGANIGAAQALDHIYGYAVGIDLTKRDRQAEAKKKGQPWERAKAFDASAPIAPIVPAARIGHPQRGTIALSVNGARRQHGDLADLILPVPGIIAQISAIWALAPGDLIYTGTPDGVGAVKRGDVLTGSVEGVGEIEVAMV
jgi:fumarylpyruvate hydrolase